jgi:site-specific DNA recombinase
MAHAMRKRQPKAVDLGIQTDCTALYIRVSTDTQAEEGFSLEAQRAKLEALCVANGWRVCDAHIYVDAGESGKSTDRPKFRAMYDAIADGAVNRVIVTKLDRLSRNTRDFLEFLDYCDSKRTAIVSIMESFDTGTPTGRAVVTILMAFAELERSQIKERVMTGKVQKARDGGYNGSRAPYGYTYSDGAFHTDDAQAAIVRRIFTEFLTGSTMKDIATRLTAQAIPTKQGGKWDASTIRYILRNGAYAGLVQWGGMEETPGTLHPAIVSEETYRAALARLKAIKPGRVRS